MPESGMVIVAVGWAVVAGILLCALAYVAVTLDAVLSARQQGVRGGWTAPLSRAARLLRRNSRVP